MSRSLSSEPNPQSSEGSGYQVVARRYRPQNFSEVVGQDHVVQALGNAIRMNRVTHAYLFSGTRGVGKTSIARIFAKCLNCETGPTLTPCNTCDICQSISVGQDVDVIEIDGASNNGVEQVRELRQNASLRPSRARTKIYYIDEVHMLSTGAFNALLKTLEEPPEHVKFFFATTEPGKIPITVLSRCQKFEFAGIRPEQITNALVAICEREGVQTDQNALMTVARRAAGSMRDAQSLLEQLLSSGHTRLTEDLIHQSLGLAPDERVLDLIDAMVDHKAADVLTIVDQAISSGTQAVDLLSALLDFLRDVMVLSSGAGSKLLESSPNTRARLAAIAERWPLDTVLLTLQILSESRSRMRGNSQPRLLLEIALCRAARLENFTELSELIGRLDGAPSSTSPAGSHTSPPSVKKKPLREPEESDKPVQNGLIRPTEPSRTKPDTQTVILTATAVPSPLLNGATALTPDTILQAWEQVAAQVDANLGKHLLRFNTFHLIEPEMVQVNVPPMYGFSADACEAAENFVKIEASLRSVLARSVQLQFVRQSQDKATVRRESPTATKALKHTDLDSDELVQDLVKLFEARPIHVEIEDETDPA